MQKEKAKISTPKLIVFDWDGTLCDSISLIISSMQSVASQLNLPVPSSKRMKAIIGLGFKEAVTELFGEKTASDTRMYSNLVEGYRHAYANPASGGEIKLFPGVENLLQRLQSQGFCLAIATGKSRKGLDDSLQQTGVGHYFQITRCADETESKPSPKMLEEIFAATGYSAQQTWMIGDSIYDLQMANAVAATAIAVSYGAFDSSELEQYSVACVDNIQQLQQLVQNTLTDKG